MKLAEKLLVWYNSRFPAHPHFQMKDASEFEKIILSEQEPFGIILSADFEKKIAEVEYTDENTEFYSNQKVYLSPPQSDQEPKECPNCSSSDIVIKCNGCLQHLPTIYAPQSNVGELKEKITEISNSMVYQHDSTDYVLVRKIREARRELLLLTQLIAKIERK